MKTQTPPRRARRLTLRLLAALIGFLFAVTLLEVLIRLAYPALPNGLQIALRFVHVTPFTDARLAPLPIWAEDAEYQMVVRPGVQNVEQVGSLSVRFPVSTYAWWGGRVGFRSQPPTDGAVQAVAIGDSHTFCFTAESDCWVNQLGAALGVNISNLGQPVTGSVSHWRRYQNFVLNPALGLKQPSLVIWQFYGNDYNDDYGLAVLNGTNRAAPPPGTAPAPDSPVVAWLKSYSAVYALIDALGRAGDPQNRLFVDPYVIEKGALRLAFGRPYLLESFDLNAERNQEGEGLSQGALLAASEAVRANGGRFLVVIVPTKEEAYAKITAPIMGEAALATLRAPRERLLQFCAANKLDCLDLTPALVAAADADQQVFFPDDIHLTPLGNQIVAGAIAAHLKGGQP